MSAVCVAQYSGDAQGHKPTSRHCRHCANLHVVMQPHKALEVQGVCTLVGRNLQCVPTCITPPTVWSTAHQKQQRSQGRQALRSWIPAPGGAVARCTLQAVLAPGLQWPPCLAGRTSIHQSSLQLQPADSQTRVLRPGAGTGYRAVVDIAENAMLHIYRR